MQRIFKRDVYSISHICACLCRGEVSSHDIRKENQISSEPTDKEEEQIRGEISHARFIIVNVGQNYVIHIG